MRRPLDLRHVISPGLRDLIELANTHDFDRVQQQVRNLRGCSRPVNLHGWTITTDAATKEVIRSYRSEDEPTGRLLTTCGNRRASRCPEGSSSQSAVTYFLRSFDSSAIAVTTLLPSGERASPSSRGSARKASRARPAPRSRDEERAADHRRARAILARGREHADREQARAGGGAATAGGLAGPCRGICGRARRRRAAATAAARGKHQRCRSREGHGAG